MALLWSTILRVLCPLIFAVMSRGETAEDIHMILIWFCKLVELKYENHGDLQITLEPGDILNF